MNLSYKSERGINMITIEQVEKLREKANVTYDEAKTALEATGGDILEAIIYLERQGKVEPPQNGGRFDFGDKKEPEQKKEYHGNGESISGLIGRFFKWVGKIIKKGNVNIFEVVKNEEAIISVPVTVLVLLLIFAFWIIVPLIIVGLFFGYRYIFKGPDLEKTGVNNVMKSASSAAENIKKEIKDGNK